MRKNEGSEVSGESTDAVAQSQPYQLVRLRSGELAVIGETLDGLPTEPGPGRYEIEGHKTVYFPGEIASPDEGETE